MPEELAQEKIVAAIRAAAEEVFSMMLGLDLVAQEANRQPNKPEPANGMVALIGLTGKWMGTGCVLCSADFARKISGQLLSSKYASVDPEVLDAVGEIANMIIGSFKIALEPEVGPLDMSIPVVVFGHNFTASSIHRADWIVVPFLCGGERLVVKACLSQQQEQHYRRASDTQTPLSQVVL
jgi:chemotaxis protein CheX